MTCSSGKLPVTLFNLFLKSPLVPSMSMQDDHVGYARKSLDLFGRMMPVASGVKVSTIHYGGVACEQHQPRTAPSNRVLLYFHGGGYCVGSPVSHRHLVSRLARECRMRAIAVDYRKAPEHAYPAALEDAVAVYLDLLAEGVKPGNIYLAGDSAGGNLVIATLLQLKTLQQPQPAAAACISPWLDMAIAGETTATKADVDLVLTVGILNEFAQRYARDIPREERGSHATLSPLAGDLAELPPLLLQVGSEEILLDDSLRFADKAAKAGTTVEVQVWERMQHVWHIGFNMLKDGRLAIREIASFFARNQ